MNQSPFDHNFTQSYLLKAGVRFDFNVVDTVCNRKLGFGFYVVLILALLVFGLPPGMPGNPVAANNEALDSTIVIGSTTRLLLMSILVLLVSYAIYSLLRYSYYLRLRAKLRTDQAPIAVEAYAVVCLDLKVKFSDYLWWLLSRALGKGDNYFCKYAVIYKEIGTENPRFFLTAAVSSRKLCFIPEHIGRVFIHRKKKHLYTLDDRSAYQTVSKKRMAIKTVMVPSSASMSSQSGKFEQKRSVKD